MKETKLSAEVLKIVRRGINDAKAGRLYRNGKRISKTEFAKLLSKVQKNK